MLSKPSDVEDLVDAVSCLLSRAASKLQNNPVLMARSSLAGYSMSARTYFSYSMKSRSGHRLMGVKIFKHLSFKVVGAAFAL